MKGMKGQSMKGIEASETYELATSPEGIVGALLKHINSLDVETMLGFYDPEAQMINAAGEPQIGRDAIAAELETYFSLGIEIEITQRHLYVAGNIAELILDWNLTGISRDGQDVNIVATANDVARRGDDGKWRYLIDNPYGTIPRPA
jgi:ketosteroid isomerase-like protein